MSHCNKCKTDIKSSRQLKGLQLANWIDGCQGTLHLLIYTANSTIRYAWHVPKPLYINADLLFSRRTILEVNEARNYCNGFYVLIKEPEAKVIMMDSVKSRCVTS